MLKLLTFFTTLQITGENLKKGIVETRIDKDLVVWRRFRHNVDMLTPFALFDVENLDSSTSQYMVYTQEKYDELLAACTGVRCGDITVKAEALFQKMKNIDLKPVNISFEGINAPHQAHNKQKIHTTGSY